MAAAATLSATAGPESAGASLRGGEAVAIVAAMVQLVLASTSRYRRELLQRLGVPFECVDPGLDETALQQRAASPITLARNLADGKATAVAGSHPQAIVIGCDQVVAIGDRILGKPGSAAAAEAQLQQLAGAAHLLITAVSVHHAKDREEFVSVATLRMRKLDRAEIARYVAQDQPIDCAGAYKLERAGIALFERIECEDHTAIVGLPLLELAAALRRFGLQVP